MITWKESQWMTLGWPEDMSMGDCLKLTDVGKYSPLVAAPLAGAGRWYDGKVFVCVCVMRCVRVGTASWTQASKQHSFIFPCSWFWVWCDRPTMMPGYFITATELKQVVWSPHSWHREEWLELKQKHSLTGLKNQREIWHYQISCMWRASWEGWDHS